MRNISIKNLEIIAGGVGPVGAAIGAVAGSTGYLAERAAAGEEFQYDQLGYAAGIGAVGGFFGGPAGSTALRTGAGAIAHTTTAFYGGLAVGSAERMMKSDGRDTAGVNYCGTNYQ